MRRQTVVLGLGLVFAGLIGARSALAANGGISYNEPVEGAFQMVVVTQNPGVTWTFTTSNLSAGADTVIHVQDATDPQGGFIAGNDDYNGTLASQVVLAPISTTRYVRVIVRRYSQSGTGTCTLTGTPSTGSGAFTYLSIPLGGDVYPIGPLPAGAHVTNAEVQGGASDTVLLVIDSTNPSRAVAFDDDDGVGAMSWVHLPAACSSGCSVVVANFSFSSPVGNTNIVWDEDADTTDTDSDGLGEALEFAIGTSPNDADSDHDGLPDGDELLGRNESVTPNGLPVKLSYMGAQAIVQDLFIELDWQQCTDPSCGGNLDLAQLGSVSSGDAIAHTQAIVAQIAADMAPLHVHLDIGRTNTDSTTWTQWGNWGGASRGDYSQGTGDPGYTEGCEGASAERPYLFHFGVSYSPYTGHVWTLPGSCMVVTNNQGSPSDPLTPARVISHESGHTLGIMHGGRPFVNSVNYKPQYESIMNYEYQWTASSYSQGQAPVPTLNPLAMDETAGVGASDSVVLNAIKNNLCGSSGSCVNFTTGAVDWNRDGIFSPSSSPVQAPASLGDYSMYGSVQAGGGALNDASMTWVNASATLGDQLWAFGRNSSDGTLQYTKASKSALNTSSGCGNMQNLNSDGPETNCAALPAATAVSGVTTALAPGAAELGTGKILLVYQVPGGSMTSKVVTINATTGNPTFGASVTLPGSFIGSSDVTVLSTGSGTASAWVQVGSRLKQWKYASNAWQTATDLTWGDGTIIQPSAGVGATLGYLPSKGTGTYIMMAIPTSPNGTVELAVQETTGTLAGRMLKQSTAWSLIGSQPMASGRPGLAYQHQVGQATNVGRYYLSFNQTSCSGAYGSPPCYTPLLETEGDLTATSATNRRLKFVQPDAYSDPSHYAFTRGMYLVDDINRDNNLRGFGTLTNGNGMFHPVADGIINGTLSDLDDYHYVIGALRAALCLDGGTWPQGVLPPSLP